MFLLSLRTSEIVLSPMWTLSGFIETDFLSMSASKMTFPSSSMISIRPVFSQFALIPTASRIFVMVVPSTRAPTFQVFPPSVDIPHPSRFSLITTRDSSKVGLSHRYKILLPSSCFTETGKSPCVSSIAFFRSSKALSISVFCFDQTALKSL